MSYKIFTKNNYFYIIDTETDKEYEALSKDVLIRRDLSNSTTFYFTGVNSFSTGNAVAFANILDADGNAYADLETWITWYTTNTGNFNSAGATAQINYSETEQNTGVKWIDGKPVYRISAKGLIDVSDGNESIILNIPNLKNVINLYGEIMISGVYYPIYYSPSSLQYVLRNNEDFYLYNKDSTVIGVSSEYNITIEYTKNI